MATPTTVEEIKEPVAANFEKIDEIKDIHVPEDLRDLGLTRSSYIFISIGNSKISRLENSIKIRF